jgi:predicted permease
MHAARFYEELVAHVRRIPGVRSAAAASILPFEGGNTANEITIEGQDPDAGGARPAASWRMVTPGYFATLAVPLRAGRVFTDQDGKEGAPPTVIVNEALARRFWPDQDPLGRRLRPGRSPTWQTVVGVVGDVRYTSLDADPGPMVYYPFEGSWNPMSVAVRAGTDREALALAIRQAARAVDPQLAVPSLRSVGELVGNSLGPRRFNATLLGVFAGIALVLATVGLYGSISYAVARRTREIGVRMALGAGPRDVVRMVVGEGLRLVAAGLAVGLAAAVALTWTMSSLLFGVSAHDPATFAAIATLLAVVALAAAYVPARRAARVDPLGAIRAE